MFKKLATATLLALIGASAAQAQDGWDGVEAAYNAANNYTQQAMQYNTMETQRNEEIVTQRVYEKMNDPAVQQAYRDHQASGSPYGQLSFYEFTYNYMATRGYSAEGVQYWNGVQQQININNANAMRSYLENQQRQGQELHDHRNAAQARVNEGWQDAITGSTWYDAPNGGQVYLPYTAQAGDSYRDSSGNTYTMTEYGYYNATDPWGSTYQVDQTQ
jgi:hypothetical protein